MIAQHPDRGPVSLGRRCTPSDTSSMRATLLLCASLGTVSATNAAGIAFLEANKEKDGVVQLPSGLQCTLTGIEAETAR